MRIGHFVSLFPSQTEDIQIYGAGRVAYHLCNHLAKRGHDIHVFVPSKKNSIEKNENNITVHFYSSPLRVGIMNISYKFLRDPLNYDVDIVHVHNDTPMSVIAGLRYAKRKKKQLIVTWHGDWMENYGGLTRRVGVYLSNKYLVDKILSNAGVVITPSNHYIKESRFLKKYKSKLIEIPNGINLKEFDIPLSKRECRNRLRLNNVENVVLFLSALYPLKGPYVLLKAIPYIVKKCKGTIFIFVGGGDINKYKELSEEIGVQKYVRFTGYIEEKLKPLYYKAADVFVLPSIETFESFGIVNLEAMACGVPIIASKIGGVPDVVKNGKNGLLVPPKDPKALADAIIYLLENEDIRRRMGERGKDMVKSYSWEKIAEQYEKVYKELLK